LINPNVFREYDIRGVVDEDFNEEFVSTLAGLLEPMPPNTK